MSADITVDTVVERKADALPRFVTVPAATLEAWQLTGTTPVRAVLGGVDVGRRSLKRWGKGRAVWFIDLTEQQCRKAGIETGARVRLVLHRESDTLPPELAALLAADAGARAAWSRRSLAEQRQLAEHVRSAKQPATRARRAAKALGIEP